MNTTNKIDIEERHYKIVVNILQKYLLPTDKVFVFGSRATFKAQKYSDLDLAIITSQELYNIIDEFEESELPFNVDILDYNKIPESFREEIDRHKKNLWYFSINVRIYADILIFLLGVILWHINQ